MQWSKIRTRLLSLIAPELEGKVDLHLTNYRRHSDHAHEVWITVDGNRVFSASYCKSMIEENILSIRTGLSVWGDGPEAKRGTDMLTDREVHDAGDVVATFRTYLDLDPHVALTSAEPLLKAFAIIDRRIGKRSLRALRLGDNEHSLVRTFYRLRLETLD